MVLAALLAVVSGGAVFDRAARAQAGGAWNTWEDFGGGPGEYHTSTTFTTSPGILAGMSSNSRGGGVGVISGQSTWLSEGTPIGAKYGSSRNEPYVNLRPQADRADSPSYTTYAFDEPVPPGGWAFALGDVDADEVKVIAKGPDGSTLTASQLGFQGAFNYCGSVSAGGPSCSGDGSDQPTWDAGTQTLTGNDAASDTDGASGWFEPTAEVASLTFVFTRRAGFPVYQTWFASLGCDVTGTVTDSGTGFEGVKVNLVDADGHVLESTTTAADGTYTFADYLVGGEYTVEVIAPDGKIVDGAKRQAVDLDSCPAAAADFALRDIVPTSVSGNVSTSDGQGLGGIPVTIALEDGTELTTVTDSDGNYLFDEVPAGDHTVTVDEPEGYDYDGASQRDVTVATGQTTPIAGQDFVLTQQPSLFGSAVACGEPMAGVTVTLTKPDGSTESTVTNGDGIYVFHGLASGDYTVAADEPEGHDAEGPMSQSVTMAGDDVDSVDFLFSKPAAVVGTVTGPGGEPMADVALTVTPEDDSARQATTGDDGVFSVGDLPAGSHSVAVTAPAGYEVVGASVRTVSNSDTCGDAVADFELAEILSDDPGVPPGDPGDEPGDEPGDDPGEEPSGDADEGPGGPAGSPGGSSHEGAYGGLPLTGAGLYPGLMAAVFLLGAGAVMVAAARARRDGSSDPLI